MTKNSPNKGVFVSILDLFSKRQKRLRGECPDAYQYTDIQKQLRVQAVFIIKDAFGIDSRAPSFSSETFKQLHNSLAKEYGFSLCKESAKDDFDAIYKYFLSTDNHEHVLDIIKLSFRYIERMVGNEAYQCYFQGTEYTPDNGISELNARFKEYGVGFQYKSGKLIRANSEYIYAEPVKPVLLLLREGREVQRSQSGTSKRRMSIIGMAGIKVFGR